MENKTEGGLKKPFNLSKLHYSNFSKPQLLIFVLAFGLIGYFLVRTFATAPVVATLEAEQMGLPTGGSILNDSTASGGKAIKLVGNGTATGSVSFASSVDSLTVVAKGDQCSGAPTMTVALDGTNLLSNMAVSATSWTSYSFTPVSAWNAGTHNLSITGSNLGTTAHGNSKKGCARDLYVDVTTFYGPSAITPPPTIALGASPTSVSAGGSSTLTWSSTNATSCTANGAWSGSELTSGSASTGALNQTSTYSLTCVGAGGSATASTTVTLSGFSTSLTQGMTINPPYTWKFNPGVTTVKGYFWADGTLLNTATPASDGSYTFVIQCGALTAGSHSLGHAWDLADGTHQTAPAAYNVTVNSCSSGTNTTSFASATNFPTPSFTPTRTVDVSSQSAFTTAWNNIQPGDLINVHGVTFTGEVVLNKQLANWAEVHFDSATRFVGVSSVQNLPDVWVKTSSHIRFYGGDISQPASGGQAGDGVEISDSSYITWWNFVIHDVGNQGLFTAGLTTANTNLDLKGEVYHWGLNLSWDNHLEKGTGEHAVLLADANYGTKNSRYAIYAHDGAVGAGLQIGGSSSTDGFWNNTIYVWCQNLTKVATSQVAGNCVEVWGDNVLNNDYKYIEAENLQGRPYDANGVYGGQSLSSNTVEYGVASNTNLNPYLAGTESGIGASVKWDTRFGPTVFQNVSPLL